MSIVNEWKNVEFELPPKDGDYFISDESKKIIGYAKYDGYGFKVDNIYREPNYWKEIEEKEKVYGKIK